MKTNPKYFFFTLFVLSLLAGFLLSSILSLTKQNTAKQALVSPNMLLTQLNSCPIGENTKSYNCTVPYINSYLKKNDIRPFFQLLEKKTQSNEIVSGSCHTLGHSAGQALFETYGYVTALGKCSPFCADGCTMGVMEKFLHMNLRKGNKHITYEDVIGRANDACEEFAKGNPVKRAACVHGTGHGLMPLVSYQTRPALDLCKSMQTIDTGSCYDAVFMEKFLPSDPVRKVPKTEYIYEYCKPYESEEEQKYRCFGYLPYAWKDWGIQPKEILNLCSTPQAHIKGCGLALVRLHVPDFIRVNDKTFFEQHQKALPELKKTMEKFGSILIIEYAPEKAKSFCENLEINEQSCMNQIYSIAKTMDIKIP